MEAQHRVATRKLVDSLAEQALLEEILEAHKPPAPPGALHYLLATPFRYPPLPHGSRFGTRAERGIWYGAEAVATVFAEVAYYRLLFLEGTAADLGTLEIPFTLYRVPVQARRAVDLTDAPFEVHRRRIASPTDYAASQALGAAMRAAGVQAFRYPSARDPAGGACLGVFDPGAFAAHSPALQQTWHCFASRARVEFLRGARGRATHHAYERACFLVDGALPAPAV